jgi:hypothetical protein
MLLNTLVFTKMALLCLPRRVDYLPYNHSNPGYPGVLFSTQQHISYTLNDIPSQRTQVYFVLLPRDIPSLRQMYAQIKAGS